MFPAVGVDLTSPNTTASPQDSMYYDGAHWQLRVSDTAGQSVWLTGVTIREDTGFVETKDARLAQ